MRRPLAKMKFREYYQKSLEKYQLNFFCSLLFLTRVSLKYFVNDCREIAININELEGN